MQVEMVPLERWIPDPHNPRSKVSDDELTELIASVAAHDVRVPLIGYRVPEGNLICDGHRRWLAAKAAGKKALPGIVFPTRPDDGDMLLAQLVINGQRVDLNPIERYEAYVRLAKLKGWSASELATGLSVKPAKVSAVLALGRLTEEQRKLVRQGKISESAGYALARMTPEERAQLVAQAAAGELTRDQLNVKARRPRAEGAAKAQRVSCQLRDGSISVRTAGGLNLTGLIDLLDELLRACRKLKSEGLDLTTAMRVLDQRCQAQAS